MATKSTGNNPSKKNSSRKPTAINQQGNGAVSASPDNRPASQAHPGIEEEIRRRAYELYEERGRKPGHHNEDWARAEAEILSRHRQKSA